MIILLIILILFLLILVLVWSLINIVLLSKASNSILKENYDSILYSNKMITSSEREDSAILLIFSGYEDEGIEQFNKHKSIFMDNLSNAKSNITIEEESAVLDSLQAYYLNYINMFENLLRKKDSAENADSNSLGQYYYQEIFPVFNRIRVFCDSLKTLNQNQMQKANTNAINRGEYAATSTLVIGLIAVLMGIIFGILASNRIVRSLFKVIDATNKISAGNYKINIKPDNIYETDVLANELMKMARKLDSFQKMQIERIINEQKKTDIVFKSLQDGIIVVDKDGQIKNVNPKAKEFLGTVADSIIGENISGILSVIESEKKEKQILDFITGESSSLEAVNVKMDSHYYEINLISLETDSGKRFGSTLLIHDITRMVEIGQMKTDFISTASHELRTPVTSIEMSINLIKEKLEERTDKSEKELLDIAVEDVYRLKLLINDLLDMSKLDRQNIITKVHDIEDIIKIPGSIRKTKMKNNDYDFKYEKTDADGKIKIDHSKMYLVFKNLIDNAVKYSKKGSTIKMSSSIKNDYYYFSIINKGNKIPKSQEKNIFEKFVRLSQSDHTPGTGLGLAMCKKIIEYHGGRIWIDQSSEDTNKFVFKLPLYRGDENEEDTDS